MVKSVDKIRILIADSNDHVRASTRCILEMKNDLEVVAEARDGEEAVALTWNYKPDVAIVDILMDKLDGIEVTRQIKSLCSNTAVLILTALNDALFVDSSLEAGASGYLLKNIRNYELIEAVRSAGIAGSATSSSVLWKVLELYDDARFLYVK
ncbi:MAG: response regulator transcription factor [Dehalococcoidia bacterium]|nr:MAG: response regulator transcription factor [Dehalococcoidia bacterium]